MPLVEEQHIAGEECIGGGVGDDGFADVAAAEHRPGVEESGERAGDPEVSMQESEGEGRDGKAEPGEGGEWQGFEIRRGDAAEEKASEGQLLGFEQSRDRLLRLQGEVIAWKAHNLLLLTDSAQGVDSGVKRMIVKYGGTMLGFRLSSLAVDALGAAGLPFESAGEDAEDDPASSDRRG